MTVVMHHVEMTPEGGRTETYWEEYLDEELVAAWTDEDGQGHKEAAARGEDCVVFACSKEDAILMSRVFLRRLVPIPSHCHYDGNTLSYYCYNGREWEENKAIAERYITQFERYKRQYKNKE